MRLEHFAAGRFQGETKDYEGQTANRSHLTRVQRGHVPIEAIADMPGVMGEKPGEHRNRQGERWDHFKSDVGTNGIQNPIFITVDHGQEPRISEGNHRRDAALELGHTHVPVEVRYFGKAERNIDRLT